MNYLLVNLAVADILYGMVVTPRIFFKILFNNHLPDGMTGTVLCKLLADGTVAWIGSGSSFVTLVAVAIERYYAVMHPHDSRWKVTKYKLKVSSFNT